MDIAKGNFFRSSRAAAAWYHVFPKLQVPLKYFCPRLCRITLHRAPSAAQLKENVCSEVLLGRGGAHGYLLFVRVRGRAIVESLSSLHRGAVSGNVRRAQRSRVEKRLAEAAFLVLLELAPGLAFALLEARLNLAHPEALGGANDGHQGASPPREARVPKAKSCRLDTARNGGAEGAAKAGRRCGNTIESPQNLFRRRRVGKHDGQGRVGQRLGGDLPDEDKKNASHAHGFRQEGEVRCQSVEERVCEDDCAERLEGPELPADDWEDKNLNDHLEETLGREDEANCFGR